MLDLLHPNRRPGELITRRTLLNQATATILITVAAIAATASRDAAAQPVRAKTARSQPKYLCEPARLGADETTTSRHFQIVDFNGDGLPDFFQMYD